MGCLPGTSTGLRLKARIPLPRCQAQRPSQVAVLQERAPWSGVLRPRGCPVLGSLSPAVVRSPVLSLLRVFLCLTVPNE